MPVPLLFGENQFVYVEPAAAVVAAQAVTQNTAECLQDTNSYQTTADGASTLPGPKVERMNAESMEDMVDDLVGAEPPTGRIRSVPSVASPVLGNGPDKEDAPSSSTVFTASDLVHQISQSQYSLPGPFSTPGQHSNHRASFGIYQTPFAPMPGEFGGSVSGSRPGTAHQSASPQFGFRRSSKAFNNETIQNERALEERSSSIASLDPPTMSTIPTTPTGVYMFAQNRSRTHLQESWPSPFSSSGSDADLARKVPKPSPFGAIGDSRSKLAKTPTSGQPD